MTNILQDIFIAIMTPMLKASYKITWKIKYQLITLMFLFIIVNTWLTRVLGYMKYYKYYALLGVGCMFVIAFLSLDGSLGRIKWNWKITAGWYSMCIVMIISDYVVMSNEGYLGYILLFSFPMVTFVWDNHSQKELLIRCLFKAVRYSFYILLLICFVSIPIGSSIRYMAFLTNPNILALYLTTVFFVLFTEFDQVIQSQTDVKKSISILVEMGVSVFFLCITQCRTTLVAILVLGLIWLIIRILFNKKDKLKIGKYILSLVIISVMSMAVSYIMLTYLPGQVNRLKEYAGCNKLTVYAQEKDISESLDQAEVDVLVEPIWKPSTNVIERMIDTLGSKSLFVITNGRNIAWRDYFEKWNLWGHEGNVLKTEEFKWKHAHNNVIHFTYMYGLLILIPYLLLNLAGLIYSFIYFKQWRGEISYAVFPFLVILGFSVVTIMEALWYPFYSIMAFVFYFAVGQMFQAKSKVKKS